MQQKFKIFIFSLHLLPRNMVPVVIYLISEYDQCPHRHPILPIWIHLCHLFFFVLLKVSKRWWHSVGHPIQKSMHSQKWRQFISTVYSPTIYLLIPHDNWLHFKSDATIHAITVEKSVHREQPGYFVLHPKRNNRRFLFLVASRQIDALQIEIIEASLIRTARRVFTIVRGWIPIPRRISPLLTTNNAGTSPLMYPVLNASSPRPFPFLSVPFWPLSRVTAEQPLSRVADAFSLRGNLSRLSDVFLSVKVCRVCVRGSPARYVCRSGGEVAAQRKGFHRDSFFSRRITAIRMRLAPWQH